MPALPRQPRRRRPSRCASSRSTDRASGPTWRSGASARRRSRARRSSSSATAARRATSPSSATSSRATRAAATADGVAGGVYNIGGGSRVSLNGALELLAAIAGRPLDVRRHERESGDVQRHRRRHRARARATSASRPPPGSRTACAPSSSGCTSARARGGRSPRPADSTVRFAPHERAPRLRQRQPRRRPSRGHRRDRGRQRGPRGRLRRRPVDRPHAGALPRALRPDRAGVSRCSTAPAPTCCASRP